MSFEDMLGISARGSSVTETSPKTLTALPADGGTSVSECVMEV